MTNNEYLIRLLQQQELSDQELRKLNGWADKIKNQLSTLSGNPKFYIAGSNAKKTIISKRYDLDIVIYWPYGPTFSLEDIYEGVGNVLKTRCKYNINRKTVSWEIPFEGGFHIDVVPGRALDRDYYEANLYRTDTKTSLKTSLKKHIDIVKNSGRTDVIRLLKLWREVNKVPLKKSFLLEMLAIKGCEGLAYQNNIEEQLHTALCYIRNNVRDCNIKDPANSNNSLCEDLTPLIRNKIYEEANKAINAGSWSEVFLH